MWIRLRLRRLRDHSLTSGNGTWEYTITAPTGSPSAAYRNRPLSCCGTPIACGLSQWAESTSATITFRAWDQTSGSEGTKVDVTRTAAPQRLDGNRDCHDHGNGCERRTSAGQQQGSTLAAQNEDSGAPTGPVGTLVSSLVTLPRPARWTTSRTWTVEHCWALPSPAPIPPTAHGGTRSTRHNWKRLGSRGHNNARLLAADANTRTTSSPTRTSTARWPTRSPSGPGTRAAAATGPGRHHTNGHHRLLTATDTASLTVNAVNDAPVNTLPTAQNIDMNTALIFSTANRQPDFSQRRRCRLELRAAPLAPRKAR